MSKLQEGKDYNEIPEFLVQIKNDSEKICQLAKNLEKCFETLGKIEKIKKNNRFWNNASLVLLTAGISMVLTAYFFTAKASIQMKHENILKDRAEQIDTQAKINKTILDARNLILGQIDSCNAPNINHSAFKKEEIQTFGKIEIANTATQYIFKDQRVTDKINQITDNFYAIKDVCSLDKNNFVVKQDRLFKELNQLVDSAIEQQNKKIQSV